MLSNLLRTLGGIFLPEKMEHESRRSTPIQLLTSLYHQLALLAAQIKTHAECAPYPHVAKRLRQIASEKETSAEQLKEWIQSRGGWVGENRTAVKSGKNHWQRMLCDLDDQRRLEHFLLLHEPRLSAESPELAEFIRRLKINEAGNREALTKLLAAADPQATQT